ncbi:hypothetical protein HDU67_003843, partial [Dinochytrium kinnereticum]
MLSRYTWLDRLKALDGLFFLRPSHFITSPTTTYTLRSPNGVLKTITVPWASIIEDHEFHAAASKGSLVYYNTFCAASTFTRRRRSLGWGPSGTAGFRGYAPSFWEMIGAEDEEFGELRKEVQSFPIRKMKVIPATSQETPYTPASQYPGGASFKLRNNTGVW